MFSKRYSNYLIKGLLSLRLLASQQPSLLIRAALEAHPSVFKDILEKFLIILNCSAIQNTLGFLSPWRLSLGRPCQLWDAWGRHEAQEDVRDGLVHVTWGGGHCYPSRTDFPHGHQGAVPKRPPFKDSGLTSPAATEHTKPSKPSCLGILRTLKSDRGLISKRSWRGTKIRTA